MLSIAKIIEDSMVFSGKFFKTSKTVLMLFILSMLVACSTTQDSSKVRISDAPKKIEVTLRASSTINPNLKGKASPLTVDIYVLRSPGQFRTLDFFSLKDNANSVLGSDIVDKRTVSIRPGASRTIQMSNDNNGRFIGVAASYRDIDNARWRAQTSIGESNAFVVQTNKSSVSISRR